MTFNEKSIESLDARDILFKNNMYNSSINRAYYGMYQLILHKLDNKDLEKIRILIKQSNIGSHAITINYYVSNILSKKVGFKEKVNAQISSISLKDLRRKADYTQDEINSRTATNAIRYCEAFMKIVK